MEEFVVQFQKIELPRLYMRRRRNIWALPCLLSISLWKCWAGKSMIFQTLKGIYASFIFIRLYINGFEICDDNMSTYGWGVFLGPSLLDHSCRFAFIIQNKKKPNHYEFYEFILRSGQVQPFLSTDLFSLCAPSNPLTPSKTLSSHTLTLTFLGLQGY